MHDADQGAVSQADEGRGVDSVEEPGLVGGEDLAALDDVLGAAHGVGRVHGEPAAGDEPVEAHADGGRCRLSVGLATAACSALQSCISDPRNNRLTV